FSADPEAFAGKFGIDGHPVTAMPGTGEAVKVLFLHQSYLRAGVTPASSTSTSAAHLNISASSAWLSDCGSGMAAPVALALLELDADAFAINGLLVPVPGEALDTHLR